MNAEKYVVKIYNKKTRLTSYVCIPRELDRESALKELMGSLLG